MKNRLMTGLGNISVKELRLDMVKKEDVLMPLVQGFARRVYRKRYGANLNTFCKELLTLISNRYGVLSCVGINTHESGRFFLEQYLDRPVEEEISGCIGEDIKREEIVEVGTMAVLQGGLCRLMMAGLAGYLTQNGKRFIVCTAVQSISNTFSNFKIPFYTIKKADRDRLKEGAADWGNYYDSQPNVIFIDLKMCLKEIENVLGNVDMGLSDDMSILIKDMFIRGMNLAEVEGYEKEEALKCSCGML